MRANPETLLGLGFLLKAYKSRNLLENLAWKAYGRVHPSYASLKLRTAD